MNNDEKPELGSVRRSMSIASAPEDSGPIEFYIRFVAKPESENPLTHLLWTLKTGDRMYMRPVAAGVFTVKDTVGEDDQRLRVMVAAGTGSAPFVSMVRSELRRNPKADLSKYVLLHGASYPADLGYRDELLGLVETHGLKYYGTVSRPKEGDGWSGDTGRVEAFFAGERLAELERRLGLAPGGFMPNNAVIFICGLQGTIGTTITNLCERGFVPDFKRMREALGVPAEAPDTLFYEQYDTEPVINIKDPAVVEPLKAQLVAALARLGGPVADMPAPVAFVAGATGFVGREVVPSAACARATTIAHVRPDSSRLDEWRERFAAQGASADASPWQVEALAAAMKAAAVTHVFCLIGTTRGRARTDAVQGNIYEAVDLGLTRMLAEAAVAAGGRPRLVYLSSVGAKAAAGSAYLKARGQAEDVVRSAGLPWVIARPSFITGAGRDDTRPGERVAAGVADGVLRLAGVLGGKGLRARYRSTTPEVLASSLVRLGLDGAPDRVVEGDDLR